MQTTKVQQLSMLTVSKGTSSRVTHNRTVSVTYITTSAQVVPAQSYIDAGDDSLVRNYLSDIWASDWDNDDDAIYDE